jgi:two-component system, chemotaxis family, CheB/CheR fusion protein
MAIASPPRAASKEVDGAIRPENVLDFPVVGIGASAGGIQALLRFFEHMPPDAGMAFVLVLHLSPTHESRADEVLQRVTKMPVVQVVEPTRIEKNCVYLISPANDLTIEAGFLHASADDRPRGRPVAIDLFFRSLADAQGSRAISIILSGTGSDGALGISRIKEQAGVTIVQDPEDAEYTEMPRSAIATGSVDIVLPVADIPSKLIELWTNARAIKLPPVENEGPDGSAQTPNDLTAEAEQALREVLDLLRARTGHDFHHYKRATVLRRIERRLQVNSLPDLQSYKAFFERRAEETVALLKDMLIGVTNFFRDRAAFAALEQDVLQKILQGKTSEDRIRVWVAGCSTGEEAYSLGMLLTELNEKGSAGPVLQLFASDIDEHAIKIARTGSYPDSILTDIAQTRVDRFFVRTPGRYLVNNALREKVLFAKHNVLRDPPFSQLNLVSCRNLLIYLDRSVQREVLETFHFALQPSGYLFLGTSESAEIASDLFTVVDKKNRIIRANVLTAKRRLTPRLLSFGPTIETADLKANIPVAGPPDLLGGLHRRVIEHHAPPSLIVNRDAKILHTSAHVGRYLSHVPGEPSQNLLTLVNPQLRLELRSALYQSQQHGNVVEVAPIRFSHNDAWTFVSISVRPFRDPAADVDVALILFEEREEVKSEQPRLSDLANNTAVTDLESELRQTREQLQSTIEHANVSTEELKASNEELQAINEELWSATEELETGKEELQSVNEELSTVNAELHNKVEETTKAVDDLGNLIASTGIATVFVDRSMRIKRYTTPAVGLFNLIDSDVGRPLLDITHRLNYPQLADDATASFETLKVIEREVSTADGRWFLARLLPYRTSDDHIDGAVLTLIDITARRSAEHDARSSEDRLKLAALTTDDYAIIVQSLDGVIVSWNKGAKRVFGYDDSEVLGQPVDIIFLPEDCADGAPLKERERATSLGRAEDGRWHLRRDGVKIYCSGVTTPLNVESFSGYAKILRDLTEQKSAESQQQLQLTSERMVRAQAEASLRLRDEFFAVLSHELKNPLNLIHVKAELLARAREVRNIAIVQEAVDAIQRSVVGQAKIIDDLLDLSRVRTGKLTLVLGPVDIALVMRSVVDASQMDAVSSEIEICVSGVDNPAIVGADGVRVEQMLWNLVRNALKFTPRGGRIVVSLFRENGWVCVEVADSGQGIAPDYLPKLFDMFSQAEGGARRDHGGLGIGLSLVKQLAEMHGGRVEARSEGLGKGACFSLWLPESALSARTEVQDVLPDSSVLKNKRILLVDDSLEALEGFRMLLEMEGAQVHAESSAEAALLTAANHDFDLVLSDIGMPTISGYEFMETLRKSDRNAAVPAIALTGFGREQDSVQALNAGFNVHLGKPVALPALLEAINRILGKDDFTT